MNYRQQQEKKCDLLEQFKKYNSIVNLSAIDYDTHFSMSGCDVCNSGGADVYECNGYSLKHHEIFDGFQVCHNCLCIEYNGID
jgi:hypothetical protein